MRVAPLPGVRTSDTWHKMVTVVSRAIRTTQPPMKHTAEQSRVPKCLRLALEDHYSLLRAAGY